MLTTTARQQEWFCTTGTETMTSTEQTLLQLIDQSQQKLTALKQPATITLGLHGIPNSGKTSLLIAWYLYRDNRDFNLNIRFDEKSLVYLRGMAEHLLETGSTQANPAAPPQSINFQVTTEDGRRFRFKLQDYAGRFIEPREQRPTNGMAAEVRRYLGGCNAVLALADARAIDYRVIDAIDMLPNPCCVIFVPTKIDELLEDPEKLFQLRATETDEVYQSILQSAPIAEIHRLFRQRLPNNKYRIAPLSALGPVFRDGQVQLQPPLRRDALRPWNAYYPLRLVVDASQRQIDEMARELSRQIDSARCELQQLGHAEREQRESRQRAEELASLQLTKRNHQLQDRLDEIREQVQIASGWDLLFQSCSLVSVLDQLASEAEENRFDSIAEGARSLVAEIRRHRIWLLATGFLVVFLATLLLFLQPIVGF